MKGSAKVTCSRNICLQESINEFILFLHLLQYYLKINRILIVLSYIEDTEKMEIEDEIKDESANITTTESITARK